MSKIGQEGVMERYLPRVVLACMHVCEHAHAHALVLWLPEMKQSLHLLFKAT